MKLKLHILPAAQLKLWPLLATVPSDFALYGGTAVALQLGHRQSVDFDFFSAKTLNRDQLLQAIPFLKDAHWVQPEMNTLDCLLKLPEGEVKLQFLAGISDRQGRVEKLQVSEDNNIHIASLRDLLATKLNTIQMRAEIKDYVDIDALLTHGLNLPDGLACARAIYGKHFDPATSIRALCSYREGYLPELNKTVQKRLTQAALAVEEIPVVKPISATI